ncbi:MULTISPECIES: ATP-grasp domain-containing protein [Alteribacter]|uniref:RimK family alpha-L-glutamate ligase n=1 Tax=Alteribacter keqinensis TaxID=2483800 RepID=A0A3M7TZP4_9BACI|nr:MULTISPECIES: RimK family alpha-L-glutamate ligase [Alteribacter]MBM7096572.1 RimK family alpha-L-glutamate ligase [Alteribacter salitolerans]RNA70224.1 RimK family alpha-L-glutamate ligase [Alteribacter keqinensis]
MRYGWLVYNSSLLTPKFLDYGKWMQRAAEAAGITLDLVLNSEVLVMIDRNGERKLRFPGHLHRPDFVHYADKDLHLARHLEATGIPLFNRSRAIEICDNKALMHTALAGSAVPVPRTIIAPKVFDGCVQGNDTFIEQIVGELGLPVIVKEAYGSFGEQVYKADTEERLRKLITEIGSKEAVFQEMVRSSEGKDVRLNVVGSQVVAAMKRTSEVDFRANVTAGGTTEPYDPSPEEEALAVLAAKVAGADFAGVDLLFGEDGPVLCEINSNPHIRSIYECTEVDVAPRMIEYIAEKVYR